MRSGLLRDYVLIQRNNPIQGPSGELIDQWTDHINAWMYIRGVSGDENINVLQARMRYADVFHTDRIVFENRIFDIVAVTDKSGMKRELELELREDTSEDG